MYANTIYLILSFPPCPLSISLLCHILQSCDFLWTVLRGPSSHAYLLYHMHRLPTVVPKCDVCHCGQVINTERQDFREQACVSWGQTAQICSGNSKTHKMEANIPQANSWQRCLFAFQHPVFHLLWLQRILAACSAIMRSLGVTRLLEVKAGAAFTSNNQNPLQPYCRQLALTHHYAAQKP